MTVCLKLCTIIDILIIIMNAIASEEMASELREEMLNLRLKCRDAAREVMHSVHDRM